MKVTQLTAPGAPRGHRVLMGTGSSLEHFARGQAGVFTRAQALQHGWNRDRLRRETAKGVVRRLLPEVFAFTAAPASRLQRCVAAVQWAGDGAALCKLTSAELHGLDAPRMGPVQVMTPRRLRPPHSQVRVYERPPLPPDHISRRPPLVLTSVPRTLFDLAWGTSRQSLDAAIDSAQAQRKANLQELWAMWGEMHERGCNGSVAFRVALERRSTGDRPPTNRNERRLFDLLEAAGLPRPLCQVPIYDGDEFLARPDFVYLDARVALQAQSARWHLGHGRQLADDRQTNRLIAAGWTVLRFWWEDVSERPEEVVRIVARTLDRASSVDLSTYRSDIRSSWSTERDEGGDDEGGAPERRARRAAW